MYLLPILRQQNYYRIGKMSGEKCSQHQKHSKLKTTQSSLQQREKFQLLSYKGLDINNQTFWLQALTENVWTDGVEKEALKVLSAENLNSKAFKSDSMGFLTNRRFSHLEAVHISRQVGRRIGQNENWSRSPPPVFMMCHQRLTYCLIL